MDKCHPQENAVLLTYFHKVDQKYMYRAFDTFAHCKGVRGIWVTKMRDDIAKVSLCTLVGSVVEVDEVEVRRNARYAADLAKMRKATKKLCACRNQQCVDRVMKALGLADQAHGYLALQGSTGLPSSTQLTEQWAIVERMAGCVRRIGGVDETLARMSEYADAICACKDTKCADAVRTKWAALEEPSGKPIEADLDKARMIGERMDACGKRLSSVDEPVPPPP